MCFVFRKLGMDLKIWDLYSESRDLKAVLCHPDLNMKILNMSRTTRVKTRKLY